MTGGMDRERTMAYLTALIAWETHGLAWLASALVPIAPVDRWHLRTLVALHAAGLEAFAVRLAARHGGLGRATLRAWAQAGAPDDRAAAGALLDGLALHDYRLARAAA